MIAHRSQPIPKNAEVKWVTYERIDGNLCRVVWAAVSDGKGMLGERRAVSIEVKW